MFSRFSKTPLLLAKNARTKIVNSSLRSLSHAASLEGYGKHLFKGAVAAPYLKKQGLAADALDKTTWTTDGSADKVAAAVLEWAQDNGASVYCHWFQPLGASGVRHGQSAQVQNTMMEVKNIHKGIFFFLA